MVLVTRLRPVFVVSSAGEMRLAGVQPSRRRVSTCWLFPHLRTRLLHVSFCSHLLSKPLPACLPLNLTFDAASALSRCRTAHAALEAIWGASVLQAVSDITTDSAPSVLN